MLTVLCLLIGFGDSALGAKYWAFILVYPLSTSEGCPMARNIDDPKTKNQIAPHALSLFHLYNIQQRTSDTQF